MLRRGRSHALVKRIVLLPPDRIMEPLTGSPVRPIDTTMIGAPTTTIARTAIDTDIEASEEPTDAVDSSDSEPTQSATDRSDDEDISTTGNAASSSLDTLSGKRKLIDIRKANDKQIWSRLRPSRNHRPLTLTLSRQAKFQQLQE